MIPKDYQWPDFSFKLASLANKSNLPSTTESQISHIEDFFCQKFNAPLFLFPSARSAISAVFQFIHMSRQHIVYAPMWSSHCVWDVISRYANPTCISSPHPDATLLVHKWGYEFITSCKDPSKVISDSVDSLFLSTKEILKGAKFEVISLPKTLGTFCGGILICKDKNFPDFLRNLRSQACADTAREQEQRKLAELRHGKNSEVWHMLEYKNFLLTPICLENISCNLKNYKLATDLITSRVDRLRKKLNMDYLPFSNSRLPCIILLCENKHKISNKEMFMRRQFNFSFQNEVEQFSEALLLPLHIGISDDAFEGFFRNIE